MPTAALADYSPSTVVWQSEHTGARDGTYTLDHADRSCGEAYGIDALASGPASPSLQGWPCPSCFIDYLDRPASGPDAPPARTFGSGSGAGSSEVRPASEKSVRFLTALVRGGFTAKGHDDVEAATAAYVAKAVAGGQKAVSAGIDRAKASGVSPIWEPRSVVASPSTAVDVVDSGPSYEPARGDVHVLDGRYLRISVSQSSGRPYTCEWSGSGWDFAPGLVRRLSTATLATAEQAAAFGAAYHRCVFCTRDLDTPESITVGYGPVCAAQRGLPWGERAETEEVAR